MKQIPVVTLSKRFRFEAAHQLLNVPPEHKCSRLHGHSYEVEIAVQGAVDTEQGWLVDYREISAVVKPLVAALDHQNLNEIEGLAYTTSEYICIWFWDRIKPNLPQLHRVTIRETASTSCDYYGETE